MPKPIRLVYCHCAHAQVLPDEVKQAVLTRLSESGCSFDAVADLCELSARQDPALKRIAGSEAIKIAACYPRAVKWLFAAAGARLPEGSVEVLNMRTGAAEQVVRRMLAPEVDSNLPSNPP